MKCFVFRITQICNKRCPTCCCGKAKEFLSPDLFKEKLSAIKGYSNAKKELPIICFTGGEPFFYRAIDKQGKKYNIVNLVDTVRTIVPKANIIIKTSGWTTHSVLDLLLDGVVSYSKDIPIDVRLGFSLFQNIGVDAEERLYHMVESILKYQNMMRIETIYDKNNISSTFKVIESILSRFWTPNSENFEAMISKPEIAYRFTIPVRCRKIISSTDFSERMILLDTMPAYPKPGNISSERFIEAEVDQTCPTIQNGPDHILYNPDLSFYHCNDAFADYSIPAFPPNRLNSVHEEFTFLEAKFAFLKKNLNEQQLTFKKKREQCVYCTKFIHSSFLGSHPLDD